MKRFVVAAVFLAVAVPCAAQEIHIDYDQSVDFSKYKTFGWYASPETSIEDTDPFMHGRIVETIENQIRDGGQVTQTDSDPDLYITYHTNELEQMRLDTDHYGYGYGPGMYWDPYWGSGWGMGTSTTSVYTYTQGTLIVDIWDAREEKLIFRGTASQIISENPQKQQKQIEKAIRKMSSKFRKMYDKARKQNNP